jgi:hypothetical protein
MARCTSLPVRNLRVALGVVAWALVFSGAAPPVQAETTLGETFASSAHCEPGTMSLQIVSPGDQYAAPYAGVVTSWSFLAPPDLPAGSQAQLKLGRPSASEVRLAGQSVAETLKPGALNTFLTRIPVRSGYIIGLTSDGGMSCSRFAADSYVVLFAESPGAPPAVVFGQRGGGAQLNLSAVLEADADRDCLGDESQDPLVSSRALAADCDLKRPQTEWVKRPPPDTPRHQIVVRYRSNDPQSIFECRLDRARFWGICHQDGDIIEAENGKHLIQIRAVDEAANVDPSPIRARFRVGRRGH